MPYQSRPISFAALDRFDNGIGAFSPPLEYHDLFHFAHELSRYLIASEVVDGEGHQALLVDPFAAEQLVRFMHDLVLRVSAASYGGFLDAKQEAVPIFRTGSLDELGLVVPPILHFLHRFGGRSPFDHPLPKRELQFWIEAVSTAITETREWLSTAQRRTHLLGRSARWQWTAAEGTASDYQVGPTPYLVWPRTNDPELVGAAFVRHSMRTPSTETAPVPIVTTSTSTALIPHPIYGSGAAHALVRLNESASDPRNVSRVPSSRALIPHPIYGPGAQNSLTRYRDLTPWPSTASSNSTTSSPPPTLPPSYLSEASFGSSDKEVMYASDCATEDSDTDSEMGEEDECIAVEPGSKPDWPIYIDSDSDE
ncbi:hypothetical protein C2E23DRAFT_889435 [Lenzites betulinus]|nr:hypothetical protein C2E23DRAFT_889435 [Lenzites betulinus]